ALRRQADYSPAVVWLERGRSSLTARERLGGLALAQGDFPRARAELEAAYEAGSRPRATRLLLADACIAQGDVGRALLVAGGLTDAASHFALAAINVYALDGEWQRTADSLSAAVALAPERADWAELAR